MAEMFTKEYLAELAEQEKKRKAIIDKSAARSSHITARVRAEEADPEKLWWSLEMPTKGIHVRFSGLFNLRFYVPPSPEFKAVDNVINRLLFPAGGVPISQLKHGKPFDVIFENSVKGDRVRGQIFKAYKIALQVYEWSNKNGCTVFQFAEKYNPEFGTLFDYELEKFFKT